ncbi:MAG: 1-acyl-sn-glycerol-3-phosphate acyltransferase [Polyangia bacterium]
MLHRVVGEDRRHHRAERLTPAVARRRSALGRAVFSSLRWFLRLVSRAYFREITVVDSPAADVAGRLFAANHWNGIVDPLVILTEAPFRASPIAKATLFELPVFSSIMRVVETVPIMRHKDAPGMQAGSNDAVFDRIAKHLADGGNVLIFPEGVSHDEPTVLPLKTGAARMLARARGLGARGLSLQAVALDFDARDKFRSRAVVTYGPVHQVDALMTSDATESVRALTNAAAHDLDALVITGESRGEVVLVREVAEMLAFEEHDRSQAARTEIARGVVAQARALGADDPRYRAVADAVETYAAARRATGLTDAQVARGAVAFRFSRLLRGLGLGLLAPLALVGAVLYQVPYRLPRLATRMAKGEVDVVSTYKLAIGLVAFPLWLALLIVLSSTLLTGPSRLAALALTLVTPFCALAWSDVLDDQRGRRLLRTASTAGVRDLARLRLLRRRGLDAIEAARR